MSTENEWVELPNGYGLMIKEGEQGREYWTDEIGGGVLVWHTALCDQYTLLAAIVEENRRQVAERQGYGTKGKPYPWITDDYCDEEFCG